jgi:hypothetical protein
MLFAIADFLLGKDSTFKRFSLFDKSAYAIHFDNICSDAENHKQFIFC